MSTDFPGVFLLACKDPLRLTEFKNVPHKNAFKHDFGIAACVITDQSRKVIFKRRFVICTWVAANSSAERSLMVRRTDGLTHCL